MSRGAPALGWKEGYFFLAAGFAAFFAAGFFAGAFFAGAFLAAIDRHLPPESAKALDVIPHSCRAHGLFIVFRFMVRARRRGIL